MTDPEFFSPAWAQAVGAALTAGPTAAQRGDKLPEYWAFFERIKAAYPASWALGCRGGPGDGDGARYLLVRWDGGAVPDARITAPGEVPAASYVLGMDYADWVALYEGYDAQRTVMYRKILLEDGDLLAFFTTIYFFAECLAVIGAVPARYPAAVAAAP